MDYWNIGHLLAKLQNQELLLKPKTAVSEESFVKPELTREKPTAENLIRTLQFQELNPQSLKMNCLERMDRAAYIKELLNLPKTLPELFFVLKNPKETNPNKELALRHETLSQKQGEISQNSNNNLANMLTQLPDTVLRDPMMQVFIQQILRDSQAQGEGNGQLTKDASEQQSESKQGNSSNGQGESRQGEVIKPNIQSNNRPIQSYQEIIEALGARGIKLGEGISSQPQTNVSNTQPNPQPAISQQQSNVSNPQPRLEPASPQQQPNVSNTQPNPQPTSPQQQPNPIYPQQQPNVSNPQPSLEPTSPQQQPNPIYPQQQPNVLNPQPSIEPTSPQQQPSPIYPQQQPSPIYPQPNVINSLNPPTEKNPSIPHNSITGNAVPVPISDDTLNRIQQFVLNNMLASNTQTINNINPVNQSANKDAMELFFSGLINLTDVGNLLKISSKSAMSALILAMANAARKGIDTSQIQDTMQFINASISVAASDSPTQTLKSLMMLYLPWLPLNSGVGFDLEIETTTGDNGSSLSVLTVLIQTLNYGNLKGLFSLTTANSVNIHITCSDKFPKSELLEKLNTESKIYSMQSNIEVEEQSPLVTEEKEIIQAKVNLSATDELNPYLLLMAHSFIRNTIFIDNLALQNV